MSELEFVWKMRVGKRQDICTFPLGPRQVEDFASLKLLDVSSGGNLLKGLTID